MNDDSGRALVSVSELARLLSADRPPVLLDVRWQVGGPDQRPAYLAAHIPGAQWCDLDRDLADPPGAGGRHPLPEPARLQATMRGWGISGDSEVVVYDGSSSIAAARAWWVLRWAGLQRVRVLDGGFAAWSAADQPIQTGIDSPRPGDVLVRPGGLPTLDAEAAARWASAGR
ncbi:MAG TPA: rhodanese-like domain-containing protein, partial [Jatrophihabitans sp.]|nr:rhodanese-like domain-containing protein [Jatrophihabitans sp.]